MSRGITSSKKDVAPVDKCVMIMIRGEGMRGKLSLGCKEKNDVIPSKPGINTMVGGEVVAEVSCG